LCAARDVATGVKPVATGEIRKADKPDLAMIVKRSGYGGAVKLAFRRADGEGNIGYCLWRYDWAKRALDWLDHGGREVVGPYHRHWIQGLLFGYSEDAIDAFLPKPSEPRSSSRPSCTCRKAGRCSPSLAGLNSGSSPTCRHQTPRRFVPCVASKHSF
jgi:hypothetical protein